MPRLPSHPARLARLGRLALLTALAGAACLTAAHAVEGANTDPQELRAHLVQSAWPGDIVRAADAVLAARPDGALAAEARAVRAEAQRTLELLRARDVRLFRSAFVDEQPGSAEDRRAAALGDRAAAARLAQAQRSAAGADPAARNRYVGWLQLASLLGDERASYELALHYRRDAQPVLAARWEAAALALGYQAPVSLDHFRK